MDEMDVTGVIFGMGVLVLGTIILVVVLIVGERFYRARAQRADLVRLTGLLERYEQTSAATVRHQESAAGELGEVRQRLDSIERLLREVD